MGQITGLVIFVFRFRHILCCCCCVSVGGWECESPISRSSDSLSLSATGKWVGCAGEIGIRNYGMELGYVRYTLVTIVPVIG